MKATILTWEFPPNVYGGAGVHATHLATALAERIEVEVRTLEEGPPPEIPGLAVRRYRPTLAPRGVPDPKVAKAFEVLSFNLSMAADPIDADIVHAHTWYTDLAGAIAKRTYGKKLVATVHSLEPMRPWKREALGTGYDLSSWMERTGLAECDAVIAVSEEMRRDLLRVYDIPRERVVVIPNGVDPETYRPKDGSESVATFGIRSPYVLFVGRLTRQKGVFDLVDAMDRVPAGTTLVLVTGKPDTPEIEEELLRAVGASPNVVWIRKVVDDAALADLYNEAAVFACPSIYEPFGITNLEAMACETPVVASRVGGIKDVVVDGVTGLLVPPGDPARLGRAVAKVMEDPSLAAKMGRAGRRRVLARFTWDRVADQTLRVYRSLTR